MRITLNKPKNIKFLLAAVMFLSVSKAAFSEESKEEKLAYMPATTQIELYKSGKLSPVDVLKAQIALYKKSNKEVNATTYTFFDQAIKQAQEAEKRYKNGTYRPLEGVTVALKDEHHDVGMKVTQGSLIHKNDPAKDYADPITEKLKAAGAILTMQTTVPEFYLSYTTNTRAWGVTKNPWNLKYTVGGSSGGSGAALAAGYATLATGSDMGGSIRIPASLCGTYGYKAAFGEIHTDLPLSHFSGSGPMAKTFGDLVLMQNIIKGPGKYSVNVHQTADLPSQYASIKGLKIAYVGGMGIAEPTKDVQAAMDKVIAVFKAQGATVNKINFSFGINESQISELFSGAALSGAMGGLFASYADKTDKMTNYAKYFVGKSAGGKYGNKMLMEAENTTKAMYKKLVDATFAKGYDIVIAPTMPTSHIPANHDFTKDKIIEDGKVQDKLVGGLYTVPFNILNWMPVISAPAV